MTRSSSQKGKFDFGKEEGRTALNWNFLERRNDSGGFLGDDETDTCKKSGGRWLDGRYWASPHTVDFRAEREEMLYCDIVYRFRYTRMDLCL